MTAILTPTADQYQVVRIVEPDQGDDANAAFRGRTPVWDRIGRQVSRELTVEQAFAENGMNWQVLTLPVYAKVGDQEIAIPDRNVTVKQHVDADGQIQYTPFDVSSERYEALDNMSLARALEPFRDKFILTTVGTALGGEQVFAVFRAHEFDLPVRVDRSIHRATKDVLQWHVIVNNFHSAGRALSVSISALRLICINGLVTVESAFSIKLPHFKGLEDIASWYMEASGQIAGVMTLQEDSFRQLTAKSFSDNEAESLFKQVFNYPDRQNYLGTGQTGDSDFANAEAVANIMGGTEQREMVSAAKMERLVRLNAKQEAADERYAAAVKRMDVFRTRALEFYHGEVADQGAAGTQWGAWQAVTALMDHGSHTDKAARAAFSGERAAYKAKAFTILQSWN